MFKRICSCFGRGTSEAPPLQAPIDSENDTTRAKAFVDQQERAVKAIVLNASPLFSQDYLIAKDHPYFQSDAFIKLVNAESTVFPGKKICEAYILVYIPNKERLRRLIDNTWSKKIAHFVDTRIYSEIKHSTSAEWFLFAKLPHPATVNKESFQQIQALPQGKEAGSLAITTAKTIEVALSLLMLDAELPKKKKFEEVVFTSNETFLTRQGIESTRTSIDIQVALGQLIVNHTPYPLKGFGAAVKVPLEVPLQDTASKH